MIIDTFTFFNELDLLEARLIFLDKHVDKFVIVESNRTHSGKVKELNFESNKSRFKQYENKIIYHPILYTTDNVYDNAWGYEFAQRNHIQETLKYFSDEDFILVSDLDEIPNPLKFDQMKATIRNNNNSVVRFIQKMYFYNLKTRQESLWNRVYATNKKNILKYTATWLRLNDGAHSEISFSHLQNGGWHLSYFMPIDKIVEKMQNFAHQEYNTEFYKDKKRIEHCIRMGIDPYGRPECNCFFVNPEVEFSSEFIKAFNKWVVA